MQMNGENEYDVIKWGETCWEYANGQKIYVYEKKCPQGVVYPCPWAISYKLLKVVTAIQSHMHII